MKTINFILALALVCFFCSCKEEESCFDEKLNQGEARVDCGGSICDPCPIEYPEFGSNGLNILAGKDTLIHGGTPLSMNAIVPNGSSLNIEIRLLAGTPWTIDQNNSWTVNEYIFDRQLFFAPDVGSADLSIAKGNEAQTDTLLIRYFENGSVETARKRFIWE